MLHLIHLGLSKDKDMVLLKVMHHLHLAMLHQLGTQQYQPTILLQVNSLIQDSNHTMANTKMSKVIVRLN